MSRSLDWGPRTSYVASVLLVPHSNHTSTSSPFGSTSPWSRAELGSMFDAGSVVAAGGVGGGVVKLTGEPRTVPTLVVAATR